MIPAFWRELPKLLRDLDRQGDVRVIVLSSTGPHFSAGMDLQVFNSSSAAATSEADAPLTQAQRALKFKETLKQLQECFTQLETIRVPVLAAIQGGCIGAGLDLVTACDCRYATSDAYFVIQETNLAMTADVGTFPRLCHLLPSGLVRELAYTGRMITYARDHSVSDALDHVGLWNASMLSHTEILEAMQAQRAKRKGQFAALPPLASDEDDIDLS